MEEERWSVTYTKDVNRKRNQRRKVRVVKMSERDAASGRSTRLTSSARRAALL